MTLCNELHSINDTGITSQVALVFAPHRRQSAHDVKICGKIRFFLLDIISSTASTLPRQTQTIHPLATPWCKNRHPCQKMQPVSFTSIFPLQSSSYFTASYPGKLSSFPCRSHFKQFVPFDWVYNIIVSTLLSLELIRHRNPHWRHIPVISISTTIQFQHWIDLCYSYKEEYHITYFMVSLVLFQFHLNFSSCVRVHVPRGDNKDWRRHGDHWNHMEVPDLSFVL